MDGIHAVPMCWPWSFQQQEIEKIFDKERPRCYFLEVLFTLFYVLAR